MLYVCPTPIGNLEDITLRVLRTLKEVDLIAAEDTRHTIKLLNHFDIKTPLISLHEHNEAARVEPLLKELKEGKQIALVSDAGMPGISDPGKLLINRVIGEGLPCTVLPGPTAAVTAYVQSGLLSDGFLFYGFLPRRRKTREEELLRLAQLPYPIIFYEAPHRLTAALEELKEFFGDRQASVSRELTKKFEETIRGTLSELLSHFSTEAPRGEFVITVAGRDESEDDAGHPSDEQIKWELQKKIDSGLTKKTAVQQVAAQFRLPKNHVYQLALEID